MKQRQLGCDLGDGISWRVPQGWNVGVLNHLVGLRTHFKLVGEAFDRSTQLVAIRRQKRMQPASIITTTIKPRACVRVATSDSGDENNNTLILVERVIS